jgi:hypothetical protein
VIGAAVATFVTPLTAPTTSASVTAERVFIVLPDRIVLERMRVINSNMPEIPNRKIVKVGTIVLNIGEL